MPELNYDSNGLITAVAQDVDTGQVLMVAMMNAKAVALTLRTRKAHFWSRSRKRLWLKGETSRNFLDVQEVKVDCDGDAVLLMVIPRGPACHSGNSSCFFADMEVQDAE